MSIVVRRAEAKDLLSIQYLIAKAGLRENGIEQNLKGFLVVLNEENQLIGTVGIEQYERDGLLRSLVLDSNIWNAQLTLEFLHLVLQYAKEQELDKIYLCSKGTNTLFQQLGFREVKEKEVPEAIQASAHYQRNIGLDTKLWACELV